MTINVVLVHGIGDQKKEWSQEIEQKLKAKVYAKLKSLLPENATIEDGEVMSISSVYWADIFQKRQEKLYDILTNSQEAVRSESPWQIFGVKLFKCIRCLMTGFFRKLQNKVISQYIGDIIGYSHPSSHEVVYPRLDDALDKLSSSEGQDQKLPVTFVAHSLGTVITSDYIYEKQKTNGDKKLHGNFLFENFFTVGSPIALFSLRYGDLQAFASPIRVESERGKWINIYDKDDPVGMSLKPLNDKYDKAVYRDVKVESGVYGLSHTNYFKKSKTLDIISHKLALDWISHNKKLEETQLESLYEEYDSILVA